MVNKEYLGLGTAPSGIRQLFAYGLKKAAEVGAENVFDYSIGNPSIPAPAKVNQSIHEVLDTIDSVKVHGYTMSAGTEGAREAVAADLRERFGVDAKGEEIFNMVSHIIGACLGVAALVICVVMSAIHHDPWTVVGSSIYGSSLIILYTMSSIYHGLKPNMGKKVLQVLDHCTIYLLIAGTYTPICLGPIRRVSAGWGWSIFGVVWALAILAITLTAIDLKKYQKFSMICYIGLGWGILIGVVPTIEAISVKGLMWLLGGGLCYTVGAILYGVGKKIKYMHSVFHLFVIAGSVLHFFCILFYVV